MENYEGYEDLFWDEPLTGPWSTSQVTISDEDMFAGAADSTPEKVEPKKELEPSKLKHPIFTYKWDSKERKEAAKAAGLKKYRATEEENIKLEKYMVDSNITEINSDWTYSYKDWSKATPWGTIVEKSTEDRKAEADAVAKKEEKSKPKDKEWFTMWWATYTSKEDYELLKSSLEWLNKLKSENPEQWKLATKKLRDKYIIK